MDDHFPEGFYYSDGYPTIYHPAPTPWGIPLRSMISKNIENLMFAGRNISVTHVALSSMRVMATCALLGQAMGTGAALALKYDCTPREVYPDHIREVQDALMEDGMFLPHIPRRVSAQTQSAKLNLTEDERARLFNGIERPRVEGDENGIVQKVGDSLVFTFDQPETIGTLRLQFDPDYSRLSISDNLKMRVFAMKLHIGRDFRPVRTAATIVRDFVVYADGTEIQRVTGNYLSLVKLPLNVKAKEIRIEWLATNGAEDVHLFAADFIG